MSACGPVRRWGRGALAVARHAALPCALLAALTGCSSWPLLSPGPEHVFPGGYRLELRGASHIPQDTLRAAVTEDLADFARRGSGRAAADDGAYSLELLLRERGHPFVRVEWSLSTDAEGIGNIVYLIETGPRTRVGDVLIEGSDALDAEELAALFRQGRGLLGTADTPYVESRVSAAVASVASLYFGAGFLRAEVGPAEVSFHAGGEVADIRLPITEGTRFRVSRIRIEGDTAVPPAELRASVAEFLGEPFFPQVAFAIRARLADRLGASGHPDADVDFEQTLDEESGAVELVYRCEAGPRVGVASIRIEGEGGTATRFVQARLGLRAGAPWSLEEERASYAALYRSGLFRRIELELERGADDTAAAAHEPPPPPGAPIEEWRDLVVRLEEGVQREAFLEPGWGSYEKARVVAGYRDRNLLGFGRTLHLEGALSTRSIRALAGVTDPWFAPEHNLISDVSIFAGEREEPSFTRRELGTAFTLQQIIDANWSAFYIYTLKLTEIRDVQVENLDEDETENVNISSVAVSPMWDSRDDVFSPSRGLRARFGLEWGSHVLGGDLDFLRTRLEASRFWPLGDRSVLAASLRTGVIAPIGDSDTIPLQERFFNGGQDSVRAFRQDQLGPADEFGNPAGGETFSVVSLEWRRRLSGKLAGALFVDAGNVSPEAADYFGFHDVRHGFGVGLRYLLPIGPLRLDVGVNPAPRDDEDRVVAHFSVGMPF